MATNKLLSDQYHLLHHTGDDSYKRWICLNRNGFNVSESVKHQQNRGIQCIQQSGRFQQPWPSPLPSTLSSLSPWAVSGHSGTTDTWWNTDTKGPTTTLGLVPAVLQQCEPHRSCGVKPLAGTGSLWVLLFHRNSSMPTPLSAQPVFSRIERLDTRKGAAEKQFLLLCRVSVKAQHIFTTVSSKACAGRMHCATLSPPQGHQQNTPSPEHMSTHRLSLVTATRDRQPRPCHLLGMVNEKKPSRAPGGCTEQSTVLLHAKWGI